MDVSQDPPADLAAGIEAKDRERCVHLLLKHYVTLTVSGSAFEWLKDPIAIGLSPYEIVSLLIQESEQSPWICYELDPPGDADAIDFRPDYIQPVPPFHDPAIQITRIEIIRKIAELCGLAGIIPTPHDRAAWTANADIRSCAETATISYGRPLQHSRIHRWCHEVLDKCSDALDRLIKLIRWLQSHKLMEDHFVYFRINPVTRQIEAVQISHSLIVKFKQRIAEITVYSVAEWSKHQSGDLSAATADILCLFFSSNNNPPVTLEQAVDRCAISVQALCIAMLSFGQAHIGKINPFFLEHPVSHFTLAGTYDAGIIQGRAISTKPLFFQLVDLTCAGDMIGSGVMAFTEDSIDGDKDFDLLIAPEDLLDLWGPGAFVPSQSPRPESISPDKWLSGIEIRSGVVYKPSTDSSKMHWEAGSADDVRKGVPFELNLRMKMTIGAIMVKQQCPTKPGPDNTVSRTNINGEIKELGTWPEKWDLRERQIGIQLGQYANATFNGTWIKSESRTRKLEGLNSKSLDFLDQPWGLLVSVCTGVAQRVALREVVAEVMLPITDGWIEKPKH